MGASTTSLAALLLLLVSVAAATDMSIISNGEQSGEETTRRMYTEYWKQATHGQRSYNAIVGEEERLYQVFKDTLRYIDEHNAATAAAKAGVHSFRLAGLIPATAVTGIADDTCFRWCCCDVGVTEEEITWRMYVEWKATNGQRSYNAIGEEERRYQVFKDTVRYINEHNAAAAASAAAAAAAAAVVAGVHSFRLRLIPPTAMTGIASHGECTLCCNWCCC